MKVAIQVALNNGWSNNAPVIHEIETRELAIEFAYLLSHQHGNTTVRLTYPIEGVKITQDYISRLNGAYIQRNAANYDYK